jgi:MoaA/NifB/PqqE/SkfB family radical SAM enzyme
MPVAEIKVRLKRFRKDFDLTMCDFTGGEPTLHPDIIEIAEYAAELGIPLCLITHGLVRPQKVEALEKAGVAEWLVSIHGTKETHGAMTRQPADDAWSRLIQALTAMKKSWRANTVLTALSAPGLPELAGYLAYLQHPPTNHNIINFNPLAGWLQRAPQASELVVRHDVALPYVREFVETYEKAGITTNLRYVPFCGYKGLESHVTNYPQIVYDPLEWDVRAYANVPNATIMDLWLQAARSGVWAESFAHAFFNFWSLRNSIGCGHRHPECEKCSLVNICDGSSKIYVEIHPKWRPESYDGEIIDDPRHFRRQAKGPQKAETKKVAKCKKAKTRKRATRSPPSR